MYLPYFIFQQQQQLYIAFWVYSQILAMEFQTVKTEDDIDFGITNENIEILSAIETKAFIHI